LFVAAEVNPLTVHKTPAVAANGLKLCGTAADTAESAPAGTSAADGEYAPNFSFHVELFAFGLAPAFARLLASGCVTGLLAPGFGVCSSATGRPKEPEAKDEGMGGLAIVCISIARLSAEGGTPEPVCEGSVAGRTGAENDARRAGPLELRSAKLGGKLAERASARGSAFVAVGPAAVESRRVSKSGVNGTKVVFMIRIVNENSLFW
jgi:hypothetical protein